MKITLTPNNRDRDMIEISSKAEVNDNVWVWGMIHRDFFNNEMLQYLEQNGAVNIDMVISKDQS